jgi:hypothetical protein
LKGQADGLVFSIYFFSETFRESFLIYETEDTTVKEFGTGFVTFIKRYSYEIFFKVLNTELNQ